FQYCHFTDVLHTALRNEDPTDVVVNVTTLDECKKSCDNYTLCRRITFERTVESEFGTCRIAFADRVGFSETARLGSVKSSKSCYNC
ncbi:hypothetical protein BaRGS_00031365, partial [Batillaria attramentaria]